MLPSLYKNIILQKENTVHLFKNTYNRIGIESVEFLTQLQMAMDNIKKQMA